MLECPFCGLAVSLIGPLLPHLLQYHAVYGGRTSLRSRCDYDTAPRINGHWLHVDAPDDETNRKIWCWCCEPLGGFFLPGSRPRRWVSADENFARHLENAGGLTAHLLELGMGLMG